MHKSQKQFQMKTHIKNNPYQVRRMHLIWLVVPFSVFHYSVCTEEPLLAETGGMRLWDSSYDFGTVVTYQCQDGMRMSYAHCNGEVWSYPNTSTICYDGVPPTPQCKIDISDPSGTLSSSDPQYQGCRVTISVPDATIMLTSTKFLVRCLYLGSLTMFKLVCYKASGLALTKALKSCIKPYNSQLSLRLHSILPFFYYAIYYLCQVSIKIHFEMPDSHLYQFEMTHPYKGPIPITTVLWNPHWKWHTIILNPYWKWPVPEKALWQNCQVKL